MCYGVLLTISLGLAILAAVFVVKYVTDRSSEVGNLPPGPAPWPVIGNLAALRGDVLHALSALRKQYGDIHRLYMGNTPVVFLHGEEACREMLITRGDDFTDKPKDFISESISKDKGIFSTSGEVWREQRRFTLHTLKDFGFGRSSLEGKIHEEISSLLDWIGHQNGRSFSLDKMFNMAVSNVLCSIVFGERFSLDDPKFLEYLRVKEENFKALGFSGALLFLPWLKHLPGDFFMYHRLLRNVAFLEDFAMGFIKEHRQSLDPQNPRDFIDVYLNEITRTQGQSTFYDEQLSGVIMDIFMAGSETISTTLLWALLFLINHPDVQSKARKEIHSLVGKSRLPSLKDRKDLPYLEATILEIQRCGDVVPLDLPRAASVTSRLGPYTIPQGTTIIPVLASLHHDPDAWPEPAKFDPSRFLSTDGVVIKSGHFLPFSAGKRNCLGKSLAKMELFLFLAALLQRFVFLPPEGVSSLPMDSTLGATKLPKPYKLRAVVET